MKSIENYIPGTGLGPDINKTTRFEYNLDGNLKKLIAENPTTGEQVTEWIYGVTVAQGSKLESKSLAYQKVYPDSTGSTDRVSFQYNRQRQEITMTDQAGTVHGYGFDMFGRGTEDAVSAFGTGVDQTVKKITRSYEVRGMLEKVSSFDTGSTPLNEVQFAYNDFSQLAKDHQSHSGAVSPGSTPNVTYSYATPGGTSNTVRRTGITYPDNSATITIAYDGTTADALSRPDALKEWSTALCSYRYLGSGVVVGVKYDAASNIELTYEDGGTGDAGDPYTGLDRFGRLVETLWKKGTDQVRSKYGRNRFGGVVWRRDVKAHAQSPGVDTEDNYYWYDALYQVAERQRGDLAGTAPDYTGISNLQQDEAWTYDATGNWQASSNTAPTSAQARINNTANEITLLSSAAGDITPAYDPAGNMTTLPQAPGTATDQYDLKWDAWNRLVEVKDGSTVVASYTYDGLTRRLTKTNATETRHYYYDDQWRPVEERVNGNKERQYTWGLRDRWDLLRRALHSGTWPIHYVLRDYLDPVAIVGTDGEIKERYAYDAFGNVRFLAPDYTSRSASDFAWDFLFHAEFRDPETKLYNYGYRYYDTGLGRWLSRDPVGEREDMNLYHMIRNCPTIYRDRYGLQRHHWIPQTGGQQEVNKLCPGLLDKDDYTTEVGDWTKLTGGHWAVHFGGDPFYRPAFSREVAISSAAPPGCECCYFMSGLLGLIQEYYALAYATQPALPPPPPALSSFYPPHKNNTADFEKKLALACYCCGEPPIRVRDRVRVKVERPIGRTWRCTAKYQDWDQDKPQGFNQEDIAVLGAVAGVLAWGVSAAAIIYAAPALVPAAAGTASGEAVTGLILAL